MFRPSRDAQTLFGEISNRRLLGGSSAVGFFFRVFRRKHTYAEDGDGDLEENEGVVAWTSKISSSLRRGSPEEAIGLYGAMLGSGNRPNFVTVLSVIKAMTCLSSENMSRMIHGSVIKMGFELEAPVGTALLGAYSSWDMSVAWKLFNQIPSKDVILWSAMVTACVKNEHYEEAFGCLRLMQHHGLQPNHVSILSILPACANHRTLRFVKEVHGYSIRRLLKCHVNVQNSLLNTYGKCGDMVTSLRVFDSISEKDFVSWRSMMHGFLENGCLGKALGAFSEMRSCGFEVDETTTLEFIDAASSQSEDLSIGAGIHGLAQKYGFLDFAFIATALLQMYSRFGQVSSARVLFSSLQHKDAIAWSAMIAAYAQRGYPCDALDAFNQMKLANEKPNEVTYASLVQACSALNIQEVGESVHAQVEKAGYSSNTFVTSALIDMYCKLGRTEQGKAFFNECPNRDLVCWSSMINGYGINGCGSEALDCFLTMLDSGIRPNDVVFLSVLSACSHCGLEYEGWSWFYAMEEEYGITPKLGHYACMVDLLSRQGNTEEALEFMRKMPVDPDVRIWGALLAGCRKANESSEIAEVAAKKLIDLDPGNTSYYVFLSNLYAEKGRWKDVEDMRILVSEKGLKKDTGYSAVEVQP